MTAFEGLSMKKLKKITEKSKQEKLCHNKNLYISIKIF